MKHIIVLIVIVSMFNVPCWGDGAKLTNLCIVKYAQEHGMKWRTHYPINCGKSIHERGLPDLDNPYIMIQIKPATDPFGYTGHWIDPKSMVVWSEKISKWVKEEK